VPDRPATALVAALALTGVLVLVLYPPIADVTTTGWFGIAVALSCLAGLLVAVGAVLAARAPSVVRFVGPAGLAAAVLGLLLTVPGGRAPRIDVWVLLQQASLGFATGVNPYLATYPDAPLEQTRTCFTYLPASMALTLPGRVLGDVRYAEALILVLGWLAIVVVARLRGGGGAVGVAVPVATLALAGVTSMRVVQQAWTDALLVGLLLVAVALVLRGRSWWAVVPIALAGGTKQHMALLVPLLVVWLGWRRTLAVAGLTGAFCLPWLLDAPERMWTCTARFFLDLPATSTSISFWRFLPGPVRSPAVVLVVLLALVLGCRFVLRTRARGPVEASAAFLLAAAAVLAAFDVVNKQSYLNQWWMVGQLVLAAVVVAALRPRRDRVERPEPPPGHVEDAARFAPLP